MIVRNAGTTIQVITQPDHAQLARRVMERCVPLLEHPRRETVLHAIAEHDNGWAEEDAAPTVDLQTGEIFDFIHAPVELRQRVWPRAVSRLTETSWAAALVAQHALTAYDRYRQDPEWVPFFDKMTSLRDGLVHTSHLELKDLLEDYIFVRLGDLISLAFCLGWSGEQRFADYAVQPIATGVVVTPDPFGGAVVPMEITARVMPGVRFESDASLHRAIERAEAVTLRGEVVGG
jgi:hypothetical protein